jgi:hypothetical protein
MTCPQKKIFLVTSLLWFVFSSAYSQEQPDKAPIIRLLNSISNFSFYLYRDYYREFITDLGDLIYLPKKQKPNHRILCNQPFYQNSHQQPYQLPHLPLDDSKFERKLTHNHFITDLRQTDVMIKQAWDSADVDEKTRQFEKERRSLIALSHCLFMSLQTQDEVSFFDECLNSKGSKKDFATIASCSMGWIIRRNGEPIYIFNTRTTSIEHE